MNIRKIAETLDGHVLNGNEHLDDEIKMGCGCDLMSDVLSFIKSENTLLLTGLTNRQVIYTADAVDIKAICFVRGKKPDEKIVKLAGKHGMVLLSTKLPMFESCGKLYKEGLKGCSEYEG
jgi:predicted transcriptional regulator